MMTETTTNAKRRTATNPTRTLRRSPTATRLHHRRERGRDLATRHHSLYLSPDLVDGDCVACLGRREQDLNSRRQFRRCCREARQPSQRVLDRFALGSGQELGSHQQVQEIEGVIDRHLLKLPHRRSQGRGPAWLGELSQMGRLGCQTVAGEY